MPLAGRPRLMLQYLEPGPAVDGADIAHLRDHLDFALEHLQPSDIAFGWRMSHQQIASLRPVIPERVTVWRWVPMLVHSGATWASDRHLQLGPGGRVPQPFGGNADFRFLCPNQDSVIEASIERAIELAREIQAAGVLLDRIRWHSPSHGPATELTCFCEHCYRLASGRGLDLALVEDELRSASRSSAGRERVVRGLLGRMAQGSLAAFLGWRTQRMTEVITELAEGVQRAGLRTSLDVFTPTLAASVGQDLRVISPLGEWAKSMTYFDAVGPATMPYEFQGYAAWLDELGPGSAAEALTGAIGFAPPGLDASGPRLDAVGTEIERLSQAVGRERAVLGFDAVELPGVCDVRDEDLTARLAVLRDSGIGWAPSWELFAIGRERIRRIADSVLERDCRRGKSHEAAPGERIDPR